MGGTLQWKGESNQMNIKLDDVMVDAEPMRYAQWHNRNREYCGSNDEYDVYFIGGKFYYAEADDPFQF